MTEQKMRPLPYHFGLSGASAADAIEYGEALVEWEKAQLVAEKDAPCSHALVSPEGTSTAYCIYCGNHFK